MRTEDNKVLGGFTPVPLVYDDEEEMVEGEEYYRKDVSKKSFIFSINNLRSYSLKYSERAVKYNQNSVGPSFGVDLNFGKQLTSNLGNSY